MLLLQGIYRALESGPLDSWYVDTVHTLDDRGDDPGHDRRSPGDHAVLESAFAGAGVVTGLALAMGALVAGALVALDPVAGVSALVVPVAVALALRLVDLVAISALMREASRHRPHEDRRVVRDVVQVVSNSSRAIATSTVLAGLVAVELFWGFGLTALEMMPAPKLAETMDDLDAAAALLGPVATGTWIIAALGAATAPIPLHLPARRQGRARPADAPSTAAVG